MGLLASQIATLPIRNDSQQPPGALNMLRVGLGALENGHKESLRGPYV